MCKKKSLRVRVGYNPKDYPDTPMQQLLDKESHTGFGFDYTFTFDCITGSGNVAVMRTALDARGGTPRLGPVLSDRHGALWLRDLAAAIPVHHRASVPRHGFWWVDEDEGSQNFNLLTRCDRAR